MQELTFTVTVKKSDDKMFYYVPIEVSEGVGRIEFLYDFYPEKVKNEIWKNEVFISLIDLEGKDVGTRGRKGEKIVVSGAYSTVGYERREIKPGTWTIALTAGRFISEEFTITLKVWLIDKRAGWYVGDTHCHTFLSDGKHSYDWIINKSIKNGLDYMIMTDHNRTVMGDLPMADGFTMIEGVEMTYPKGHANVWGVKKPYSKSHSTNDFNEWLKMKEECENNGAIVCINHPLCKKCPWLWPLENEDFYDLIEVWNGPMRPDNQACIEWWHKKLTEGKKLKIVGGSDYHNDFGVTNLLGNPVTWVYSESDSPADILSGIKAGHTSISEKAKGGTFIEITSGEAIAGDTVKLDGKAKVKVKVKNFKRGQTLYIKDGEGVLFKMKAERTGDFETEVEVTKKGFVRAETKQIYKGLKKLLINVVLYFMIRQQAFKPHPEYCTALTSPIYFE